MEYEKLVKRYRKRPLWTKESNTLKQVSYNHEKITRLIPHRHPFLLIDSIEGIDYKTETIMGRRHIDPDDHVFIGHFPDYPVYPGVLHIEMIGQCALCYLALINNGKSIPEPDTHDRRVNVRILKIHHTVFQYEIRPDDVVSIAAQIIRVDGFTITGIGQIMKSDVVCTVVIAEFYIVN